MLHTNGFVCILGWPLDFTLSPAVHSAAFRRVGLDWSYFSCPVPPELLGEAVAGLRALGAVGANVTIPHKEKVTVHLDDLSGHARTIGAVNTIQRLGDRLIGHNTDIDGFKEFVRGDAGIDVKGSAVTVLGAGGAARAVVTALAELGASTITIVARRPDAAAPLNELSGRTDSRVVGWDGAEAATADAAVVVNTTPLGDPVPRARWSTDQIAVDLNYGPKVSAFMTAARASGAEAWGGVGMLVRQAAASFRIWTGQDPPLEVMSASAIHAIGSSGSTRPR